MRFKNEICSQSQSSRIYGIPPDTDCPDATSRIARKASPGETSGD